jgi:hypothetical protein
MSLKSIRQLDEQAVTRLQLEVLKSQAQHDPVAKAYLERLRPSTCVRCGRQTMTVDGKKMACPTCQRAVARETQAKMKRGELVNE